MARVNTVNPGDGHRGRDEFPRETDEYRGAHRRADEPDEAYEEYEYVEAEPVDAAGAGYPAAEEERAGSTAAATGDGAAAAGLPKRGLAMILLAVGLLLLLWGIFALGKGGDSSGDSSENAAQETPVSQPADAGASDPSASGAANGDAANNNAADKEAGKEADNAASKDADNDAENADKPADAANNNPENNNPDGAAQPNPAAPDLTAQNAQVYVYNNSGVPELASQTAGKLDGQYSVANNSRDAAAMNMPEQTFGVFPETFVFYNPQVTGAEQVAADIAQRVGGTPRATNDLPGGETQLPSEAIQNRHAITVVLAGQ